MSLDWTALNAFLERWGFPVALLVAIGIVSWFRLLPLVQKRIDRVDRLIDEQQAKLEDNQRDYQRQSDERVQLFATTMSQVAASFNQAQDRIVRSLEAHDANSTKQHAQIVQSLQVQSQALQGLAKSQQETNERLARLVAARARRTRRPK